MLPTASRRRIPPLLALLACTGCASSGGWDGLSIHDLASADRIERQRLLVSGEGEQVVVRVENGAITIRHAAGFAPRLEATVRAWAPTPAEAEDRLTRIRIDTNASDGVLRIGTRPGESAFGPREPIDDPDQLVAAPRIDLVVWLPEGVSIDARTLDGAIVIDGPFRDCRIASEHGDLSVTNVHGEVELATRSGALSLRGSSVGVGALRTDFGNLEIAECDFDELHASTRSGGITVRDVRTARSIVLHTNYGGIGAARCEGMLTASTASGDIEIREHRGTANGRTQHGTVRIQGQLDVVDARAVAGDVRIEAAYGTNITGEWNLSSDIGDIFVVLPDGAGARLSAWSGFESVRSDFPIAVEASTPRPGMRDQLAGVLGQGGDGLIRAQARAGSIKFVRAH